MGLGRKDHILRYSICKKLNFAYANLIILRLSARPLLVFDGYCVLLKQNAKLRPPTYSMKSSSSLMEYL